MIELTSNDYQLCNYVIFLIYACIMLEEHNYTIYMQARIQGGEGAFEHAFS